MDELTAERDRLLREASRRDEALRLACDALERINYKRYNCRNADHFECAKKLGECLDIAQGALYALDAILKGGG